MPTKMLAAVDTETAPPMPRTRPSARDKARTTAGITPQWNISADRALNTSTIGSAWKASVKVPPATVSW